MKEQHFHNLYSHVNWRLFLSRLTSPPLILSSQKPPKPPRGGRVAHECSRQSQPEKWSWPHQQRERFKPSMFLRRVSAKAVLETLRV